MASTIRPNRLPAALSSLLRQATTSQSRHLQVFSVSPRRPHTPRLSNIYKTINTTTLSFHTTPSRNATSGDGSPPPTDFGALDVLGNTPIPSTAIDVCTSSGFVLNNGARITDGSGVLVVGGEAFKWRPWPTTQRLQNPKGQFSISASSLSLLGQLWPRPDLLVLGLGPENRPITPELRRAIGEMGIRVEVLDTRNAAAQFNLLVTERGVDDVAAALVPIGWREGAGAGTESAADDISHE
ncbi:hypothetical protein BJ170DRAFT_595709 [Xylariales sp. AK1849]|nr:hypothetical protein BJ170DRAFT_595709 [Xylariales sp. AK1849]